MEEHIARYKSMDDKRSLLLQFDVEEPGNPKPTRRVNNNEFDIYEIYRQVMDNKKVQLLLNPFQDESEGCQMCYKIYACITCFIILLVLYLLIRYQ